MRKMVIRKTALVLTIMALACAFGSTYAQSEEKEKGPALLELEAAAGKKIEDVNVPKVPEPTLDKSSYEVNSSTSSYEVNTSSTSSQGKKP